jgi:mono/diheme cytochrome c family protein
MRNGLRETSLVCAAMMAIALMASVAARQGQAGRAPQPATAPGAVRDAANGQASYTRIGCDICHGVDGGGTAAGPRIAAVALPIQAFMAYVRKPTGTMPPQTSAVLPDRDLTDIYAFLHSSAVQPTRTAPAAPPGRAEAGAMLYKKNGCYECHVNDAQGGPQGPRLGPNPIPFPRFATYVRNPTGDMPPFTAKVLSDQDLASIYAFLEARPRPPAVNTIPLLAP